MAAYKVELQSQMVVCLFNIYLFGALGLSCGMRDFLSLLQHVEYLEVSCRI